MCAAQGWWALLWTPVGFIVGTWVSAQVVLPLLLGLPIAMRLVAQRAMRPAALGYIVIAPVSWVAVPVACGLIWPTAAADIAGNTALTLGAALGTIAILLSPFSREKRSEFRIDFDNAYGKFSLPADGHARQDGPKGMPVVAGVATHESEAQEAPPAEDPITTIRTALRELAFVCAMPEGARARHFVEFKVQLYSAQHLAICKEATAYCAAQLWWRVKGELPRGEQYDRIIDLVRGVELIVEQMLARTELDESSRKSEGEAIGSYARAAVVEYEKLGRDPGRQRAEFQTRLAASPRLSSIPQLAPLLAAEYERDFDLWARAHPGVFVPTSLVRGDRSPSSSEESLTFAEAVDLCAEYGAVFADLNDAGMTFKPETQLPASRQRIKAALRISLRGDPLMSDPHRQAHSVMYANLALFVLNSDSERAAQIAGKPYVERIAGREVPSIPPLKDGVQYFGFPTLVTPQRYVEGVEWFGKEFYNSQHYAERDSADARFMRSLALRCWMDMEALGREWREFVNAHGL